MRTLIISVIALLTASPALAKKKNKEPEDPVIEMIKAEDVKAMIEANDADAKVEQAVDNDNDPILRVYTPSLQYTVLFYRCEAEVGCASLQFRAYWSVEAPVESQVLHTYETERRVGRVYLDRDGDPTIETNVWLEGGVTSDHIDARHKDFLNAAKVFGSRLVAAQNAE